MTKDEFNELLEYVVNKKRIFDITTEELKKQIEETGKSFRLIDAPTHRISIALANQKHEVESYSLTYQNPGSGLREGHVRRYTRQPDEV